MKRKPYFHILSTYFSLLLAQNLSAQTAAPPNIFKDSVYTGIKLTSNIEYGSNFNYFFNKIDTLLLDTYEPDSIINYRRPVIIYCHGGGFTRGSKTTDRSKDFGDYFSKFGYLVASIDYRLGIEDLSDTIDNYEEVYQATEDAKAAVRFFRRYADEYCVDTSAIFMIGTSAGASICLTAAYWQQSEADAIFNTAPFGSLENSSGNPGFSSQLNAIISCWGGLPDTAWMQHETEPNQLFHGTNDSTVPYIAGFNPDSVYLFGSYTIHDASERNNIESYLHPFIGAGHGVGQFSPEFDTLEHITTAFIFAHLTAGEGSTFCEVNGVSDSSSVPGLHVFPNPSDGHFSFVNTGPFNGSIEISDEEGRLLCNRPIGLNGNQQHDVDLSMYAPGVYFLTLIDTSGLRVFKIVIGQK